MDDTVLLGEDFNLFTSELGSNNEKKFSHQLAGAVVGNVIFIINIIITR